jgi:hypothetical protein
MVEVLENLNLPTFMHIPLPKPVEIVLSLDFRSPFSVTIKRGVGLAMQMRWVVCMHEFSKSRFGEEHKVLWYLTCYQYASNLFPEHTVLNIGIFFF